MKKQITLILAVAAVSGLAFFASAEESPENQAKKRPAPPSAEELFAKMDKNSDGQLSLEEFQEAMKDRPHFDGKRGPGHGKPFGKEFGRDFDRERGVREHGDRGPGKDKGPRERKDFGPPGKGQFDGHPGHHGPAPMFGRMDGGMMGGKMSGMDRMRRPGGPAMQGAPIIIVINGMQGHDAPFWHPFQGKGHKPFPGKPNFGPGPCCDDKPCHKPCDKCSKDDCMCPCQGKGQCPIMEKVEEVAE